MSALTVTLRHLLTIPGFSQRPGFCVPQSRAWFERHGLDWHAFRREGLPAAVFEATGDGLALALVEWARTCAMQEATGGQ